MTTIDHSYRAIRNQVESPFLRLPPEIRTTIYTYILAGTDIQLVSRVCIPARLSRSNSHDPYPEPTKESQRTWAFVRSMELSTSLEQKRLELATHLFNPQLLNSSLKLRQSLSLLLTCRQLYHETRFLPFSLNTFWFSSPSLLRSALHDLHPAQVRAITSARLSLTLGSYDDVQSWRDTCTVPLVSTLSGLRHLVLYLNFGFPDIRSHIAPQCVQMNNFLWIELYRFQRLPLTSCRVCVSDAAALQAPDEGLRSYSSAFARESGFRWTREQKREVEHCIRDRLLAPWDQRARELEKSTLVVMRRHHQADFWNLWRP